MNPLTKIRSIAIGKANGLQRCHRHLAQLAPAFAEWSAGEIYVCRKTGTYRYRFGETSKSIAPWDGLARELFATPTAFAFAALVLGPAKTQPNPKPAAKPASNGRVDVLSLSKAA